jgi:glycosyltransferase involved in cell wall biosynthesis
MKLSILIPSVPSRFKKMEKLFKKLESQGGDVEILVFTDNKKRSIGYKRDALVQIARGDYLAFVDDDDDISGDYVKEILSSLEGDIVVFKSEATLNGKKLIVDFDKDYENEEVTPDGEGGLRDVKRRPFHVCVWKSSLAKKFHFPDSNYGEDWKWCEQVLGEVKTQTKINKVLHYYNFKNELSEASNS